LTVTEDIIADLITTKLVISQCLNIFVSKLCSAVNYTYVQYSLQLLARLLTLSTHINIKTYNEIYALHMQGGPAKVRPTYIFAGSI